MNTIGDYRKRAEQHRPTDEQVIAVAIRELAGTGLKPRDISTALRIGLGAVMQTLRESE